MTKKGSRHTEVEILLKLAQEGGEALRQEFIISSGSLGLQVVDGSLLTDRAFKRYDWQNRGVPVIEKALSNLRKNGLIETLGKGEGIAFRRYYRLKCGTLEDLMKIYIFIYLSSDEDKPSRKILRFLKSVFYKSSLDIYFADIIYYLGLWNEAKYPVSVKSYERMIRFKKAENESDTRISGFSKACIMQDRHIARALVPFEGAAKYQQALEYAGALSTLPLLAGDRDFSEYLDKESGTLSAKLRKHENATKFFLHLKLHAESDGANSKMVDGESLCYWFNAFWYGNLIEFTRRTEYAGRNRELLDLNNMICVPDNSVLINGTHSFQNLYALKLVGYMEDISSWIAERQAEQKGLRERVKILLLIKEESKRVPITEYGKDFLRNYFCSTTTSNFVPPEFLEEIEEELGLRIPIMASPSLEFYDNFHESDLFDSIFEMRSKEIRKSVCA